MNIQSITQKIVFYGKGHKIISALAALIVVAEQWGGVGQPGDRETRLLMGRLLPWTQRV
jgi:hypothetical protein